MLCGVLFAKSNDYSLRVAYGYGSNEDLGKILLGYLESHPQLDLRVLALDAGYLISKNSFDLPLDFYVKFGLAKFNEDHFSDTYENTLYLKAYYNFDFYSNRVRFGFGEGGSYTYNILEAEAFEADEKDYKVSYFLNYLDISLDFDFGKLIEYKPLYRTYVGVLLKHRSGIFGLINGVHGGSNYNCFFIEKNF